MINLFTELKATIKNPIRDNDWTSRKDVTQVWEEVKDLEPFSQVNNAEMKDRILSPTHPRRNGSLRVVAVSDTHSIPLSKLNLPAGDVLVHAGDITMYGSEHEVLDFDNYLGKLLKAKLYRQIIVIAGNHDEFLETFVSLSKRTENTKRPPFNNCIYLCDQSVTIAGVKFYGSPWVPLYREWAFVLKRGDELDKRWQAIPDDTDVLITHTPPLGALDLSSHEKRGGCLSLLGHVLNRVKPKFHVFGHIHEAHGVLSTESTTFVNAAICNKSYQFKQQPIVFDVPIPIGYSKRELYKGSPEPEQELSQSLAELTLN